MNSRDAKDFDLIVLGGGSAGFAAAIKGADIGARVAIIEGGTLGGTCVNVGCVPSKTLLRAAEAQHNRAHHGFKGIPASDGRPDWNLVRRDKDELVATLRREKYTDVLRSYASVSLIQERAELTSDHSVLLTGGRTLTANRIILATGSSPWAAPLPGLSMTPYLDSTSAMSLERLPDSLVVIGGGSVGLELAQMFARLGVDVTILEALPHLLPGDDAALGEALAAHLREEGLTILTGVQIESLGSENNRRTVELRVAGRPERVSASDILIATGRRANSTGLGLERAGINVGNKGQVVVDEFLQTSRDSVYAAGDVIGDPMFVYVAAYAGSLAAENALNGNGRRYDLSAVPSVTFTDPAVASVGLTETAARDRGIDAMVARLGLEHVPRARAARDTRGFIQLVADAGTQRIIGAQVIASEAGELIAEVALAVRLGVTTEQITSSFHPYLTLAEGLKLAAQTFTTDVSKLSCCAA